MGSRDSWAPPAGREPGKDTSPFHVQLSALNSEHELLWALPEILGPMAEIPPFASLGGAGWGSHGHLGSTGP